ncbi:hypothetical protein Phi18:3_gp005 [Cellulophaga phage phi18:3]|uniref:Uncharacterized protein n=1 Tax=Cellulophaga phage phi18:3 TaxID=1327983 RepID=S0A216_9CAUD|nr:hypothetical protein Phi18:3_gp005 [Cellulophaga phage phi18:3]AGO48517.1 hypothetical protein Phi18:3_gp005 [Cellulophaga phage phi18:3]
MGEIAIYKQENQTLGGVAFVTNTLSQLSIRNANAHELNKAFTHFVTELSLRLGIKESISNLDKIDVLELIMSKYKNLSFDEFMYAFKMERYGNLGERVEHYQLFNAEYVSKVLDKYVNWKRKIKMEHNIAKASKPNTATEREKQYWINRAVTELFDHYEENYAVLDGKIFIYDVFYDLGFLPTDVAYKKKIHKESIEVIEFEQNSKKPSTLAERNQIAEVLSEIRSPNSAKVKMKCKELVLLEFLRKIFKDPSEIEKLRKQFKN